MDAKMRSVTIKISSLLNGPPCMFGLSRSTKETLELLEIDIATAEGGNGA